MHGAGNMWPLALFLTLVGTVDTAALFGVFGVAPTKPAVSGPLRDGRSGPYSSLGSVFEVPGNGEHLK